MKNINYKSILTLLTIFIMLISFSGSAFATEDLSHETIYDNMDAFSKFKYEMTKLFGGSTTFSALGETLHCDTTPDKSGSYIVDSTYKKTISCGSGYHLIDLYTSSYHFIKEELVSNTGITFTHNLIGSKYIYECYSCPESYSEPTPTPTPTLTDPCVGISCNDYCAGTSLYKNGKCSSGSCQYTTESQSNTCGYVAPTPTYTPPVDNVIYPNPTDSKPDNTLAYIVLGFVSLILIGLVAIVTSKSGKKKKK